MAPTAVYPTVTLTRDQVDALAAWLWDLRGSKQDDEEFRLMRVCMHLFDAVERAAETYDIAVDAEVAWLAAEILPHELEEYAKPQLAECAESLDECPDDHDLFKDFVTLLQEQHAQTEAEAERVAREFLDGRQQQYAETENFIAAAAKLIDCAMAPALAAA